MGSSQGVLMSYIKTFFKCLILACVGGVSYIIIEFLYRGYSHWTMFMASSLAFVLIGAINEIIPWEMKLWKQMLIGSCIVTVIEFISGLIINVWLGLDVWDYSNLPLNVMGQICLPFSIIWFFMSLLCIVLDDYLRYWFFGEEKPHYSIW